VNFPKPEARRLAKARARRSCHAARKACREVVWARAGGRCERCRARVVQPKDAAWFGAAGHVHEIKFRSRGGDPNDPTGAVLLCWKCHMGPGGAHA
jgi:hypothetical protein